MATITTEVEVDIEEFNTQEILQELKYRIKNNRIQKYEEDEVIKICREIIENSSLRIPKLSMIDVMKLELFYEGMDKKTLTDFENFFR